MFDPAGNPLHPSYPIARVSAEPRSATARSRPSTGSIWPCIRARFWPCSARTAPARPPDQPLARPRPGRLLGTVAVFGRDPRDLAVRTRVGAMLQISGVPPTLKVREHLELASSYYPDPFPLPELLALAGLEGLAERRYGQLSGGQQQRVLFALAICGRPSLLFLDEPTVGLDLEARRALWTAIESLAAGGAAILLTTHYLEEAERLAHRVAVLDHGRIVALGTPAEVKGRVAGRKISCRTGLSSAEITALPGAGEAESLGGRIEIASSDPENLLRALLARDPELSELEVRQLGLEEALRSLTGSRPTVSDLERAA